MWLQVNKETKRIQGYIEYCCNKPIPEDGCELVEVNDIPTDWQFSRYENGKIIPDVEYKSSKLLEEQLREIRMRREIECFPFINRGFLWYDTLTEEQKKELKKWYQEWLDAPQTRSIPVMPAWVK